MKYLKITLVTCLIFPLIGLSAPAEFIIVTQIGFDTTPPSIPTNLIVVPVSDNQINLSWSASTDDTAVSGYQVFRDSVQIATTTLISYVDAGLSPLTLYSYDIIAFDAAANFSSSSSPVATTTLSAVVATSSPSSSQSSGSRLMPIEIYNWVVTAGLNSITITFDTSVYAASSLRWGRTSSYEQGYSASNILKNTHKVYIPNLATGVRYEFSLELSDRFGRERTYKQFVVSTAQATDNTPPANVMNFKAVQDGKKVNLTWDNPKDLDFAKVRIVRSDKFYPSDIADGWTIFEGRGESAKDELDFDRTRYYTAFAYDKAGNISSGAVTFVGSKDPSDIITQPVATTTIESEEGVVSISFDDILFIQNNNIVKVNEFGVRTLLSDSNTTIAIPYELFATSLKTIVVRFVHPENKDAVFAFLLKVNKDKTYYEATIGALSDIGQYDLRAEVYDFNTKRMSRISGVVEVEYQSSKNDKSGISYLLLLSISLLLFFVFLVSYLYYKFRNNEDS